MTPADIIVVSIAIGVSFLLGGLRRLVSYIGEQRTETLRAGADFRDHVERSDEQINRLRRLQDEMDALKLMIARTSEKAAAQKSQPSRMDPVKLARSGADIETIMSRCKLSRAEAELVHSVHAPVGLDRAA